jgi:hypothetical protein
MKLLNTNIWVFIIVLVITTILSLFYILVKPDKAPLYNVSPFPDIYPTGIPPATTIVNMKCKKQPRACATTEECSKFCGDNYECTPVNQGEQVFVNGVMLQPGNWCLPKKKEFGCGTYTGRAVWSTDESGKEAWDCVCLYPELFGGDECIKPLACVDVLADVSQTDNVLQDKQGRKWDPSLPNFFPPDGKSPYAFDGNEPMFTCNCNQNKNIPDQFKFVQLPNDPYKCHLAPCSDDHVAIAWNPNTKTCDCEKLSGKADVYAKSNIDGKCRKQVCTLSGSWNPAEQKCDCPLGSYTLLCNSNYYNRGPTCASSSSTDCFPKCPDMDNAGGSMCINPCHKGQCLNGGQCVATSSTDYYCGCPKGTNAQGKQGCTDGCKIQGKSSHGRSVPPVAWEWCGKHCQGECIQGGQPIGECIFLGPHIPCQQKTQWSDSDCCSGKSVTKAGSGGEGTTTYCTDPQKDGFGKICQP